MHIKSSIHHFCGATHYCESVTLKNEMEMQKT